MSHGYTPFERAILRVSLDTLIADHGAWRVARAALAALFRRRRRGPVMHPQDLPNCIRRDIGLPPIVDPPTHLWPHF